MQRTILLAVFLTYILPLNAQLVNIESKRKGNKEGLIGVYAFSFDYKQSTKDIIQVKNNINVQYKKKGHTLLLINDINYLSVTEQAALINGGLEHIRYNYTLNNGLSRVTYEAFVQHQYNHIKLLQTRFITGGGPRFRVFGNDTSRYYLFLCPLFMYEYEQLKEELIAENEPEEISRMKGDFYISTGYQITKHIAINHVTYYQPFFGNLRDYRLSIDTSLDFKFSEKFSFGFIINFEYDSAPPRTPTGELRNLFTTFNNRIIYSF